MFSSTLRQLARAHSRRPLSTILSNFSSHRTPPPVLVSRSTIIQVKYYCDIGELTVDKKLPRKKTPIEPKITLLDHLGGMTVTTIAEATKIAESRHLKLVHIQDPDMRTKRMVYQLMTEAQYLEEDLKERKKSKEEKKKSNSAVKGQKMMMLSCKISEHDLQLKLSKLLRFVNKKYETRVIIAGPEGDFTQQEKVYAIFEKELEGKARVLQKLRKSCDVRFTVLPTKEALLGQAAALVTSFDTPEEPDDQESYEPGQQDKQEENKDDFDLERDVFSKV